MLSKLQYLVINVSTFKAYSIHYCVKYFYLLCLGENSSEFLTVRPEENQTVTLTLVNEATNSDFQIIVVNTSLVGNSTDFIEYNVEPSSFLRSVPFNSSIDFSIAISVSANAVDGDAATFTVLAESTSDSDINDFISFDLVVTTSPPPEFTENEVRSYTRN